MKLSLSESRSRELPVRRLYLAKEPKDDPVVDEEFLFRFRLSR